ncbi:hypothetical protein M5K25_009347 [Dendrobium thyrsiflorum]|uniref:Uncharacterized protein n=1 Tax=Dendrobium thyrsiflorum TaxID=117978 RepID=A0ABD0VC85_DENTH
MASEDEKVAISLPVHQTLVSTTAPFALCFAFSFYFFLIQNLNSPLAFAIKLANGVIQATSTFKYLKSPSPSFATLFFASKLVIKGFKFSQRLIPTGVVVGPSPSPIAARKLKACVAAINLLRYAHYPPYANMPMGLGFLHSGQKISKNILNVLDGFIGLQLDAVVRRSVDALGLLFKTAVILRVIGERVGRNGWVWRRNMYVFWRVWDLRSGVCLRCKRSYFDRIVIEKRLPCFRGLDFGDCNVAGVKQMEVSVSELLSLSIPLEKVDMRRFGFGLLSTARDLESCSSSRIEEHCIFLCFIASTSGIQSFGVIFLKFPLSFYCFSSVFGCFPAVNSSFRIGSLRFWVGNA